VEREKGREGGSERGDDDRGRKGRKGGKEEGREGGRVEWGEGEDEEREGRRKGERAGVAYLEHNGAGWFVESCGVTTRRGCELIRRPHEECMPSNQQLHHTHPPSLPPSLPPHPASPRLEPSSTSRHVVPPTPTSFAYTSPSQQQR